MYVRAVTHCTCKWLLLCFPQEVNSFSKIFFSDDSAKILVSPKSKLSASKGENQINVEDVTLI